MGVVLRTRTESSAGERSEKMFRASRKSGYAMAALLPSSSSSPVGFGSGGVLCAAAAAVGWMAITEALVGYNPG